MSEEIKNGLRIVSIAKQHGVDLSVPDAIKLWDTYEAAENPWTYFSGTACLDDKSDEEIWSKLTATMEKIQAALAKAEELLVQHIAHDISFVLDVVADQFDIPLSTLEHWYYGALTLH